MVLALSSILARLAMSKLIVVAGLLCYTSLAFSGSNGSANALQLLISNGGELLASHPDCSLFTGNKPKGVNSDQPGHSLLDDIDNFFADTTVRPVKITEECSVDQNQPRWCQVVFSNDDEELSWSRVYQFEIHNGSLKNLRCFNIP